MDDLRYGFKGDAYPHSAHGHLLAMAGSGRRVFDVGCASGYLAKELRARGCSVVGLELDPAAAEAARAHCEKVIVGSAEDPAALAGAGTGFDVILCGDVLEHLLRPEVPLAAFQKMLAPEGSLIVSLPNVAYLSVRLGLFLGRFEYRDSGILDRTHLRFFTLGSARRFLATQGWREAEMRPSSGRLPYSLVRLRPTLLSPQFVFRLRPASTA